MFGKVAFMPQIRVRRAFPTGRALALGLAMVAVTSCGGSADGSASGVSLVEGVTAEVQGVDNSFRPETLTVAAGTEVVFTNKGRANHNVVPNPDDPDRTDWGVIEAAKFAPGDVYTHRFTEPGEYRYYCTLHGTKNKGMVGTITVTG